MFGSHVWSRRLAALVLLTTFAVGCTSNDLQLVVDVKTDLVANEEFVRVETELFEGPPTASSAPLATDTFDAADIVANRFASGVRVAELTGLAAGTPVVRVRLIALDGSIVLERSASLTFEQSRAVTLLLTRSCTNVECPGAGEPELTECQGGQCIDPRCTVEDADRCPMAECVESSECSASAADCAMNRCESGVCLSVGDDSRCTPEMWCNPERGCEPRTRPPVDAGAIDGGMADAGDTDAGPIETDAGVDAGPSCTPSSCADLGAECGAPPDGCGSTATCSPCTLPEVCGGGTTPFVCAEPPATDTLDPTVTILMGPADPSAPTTADLLFTGSDTGGSGLDRFECRLDTGTWSTCTSPQRYPGLSMGAHTFRLRAFDGAGNRSTVATWTWTLDSGAPACAVSTSTACSGDASPRIDYSCTDAAGIVSRECRLDAGAWGACTSATSHSLSRLSDGSHTLRVRATDTAGNRSTPVLHTWTVDGTRPSVSIATGPTDPTASDSATIRFTASDAGCTPFTTICRLDDGRWTACTSGIGMLYSGLADGSHTFRVQANDGAGNSTESTQTWTVDTTPPQIRIVAIVDPAPGNYTATPMVSFTYSCDDGAGSGCTSGTRSCRLDGVDATGSGDLTCSWLAGTAHVGFTGDFTFGGHTLEVTVADAVGNRGSSMASLTVTRCATDLQYPSRASTGFTRGLCCTGLVDTSSWTDFSFGFWHPRGDGSCRPMSDWQAQPWECIWGGASCPAGYRTTSDWGAGCSTARGRTTCVPSLGDAQIHCGTDGGSGAQTPLHGRANEGWHPAASAGCSRGSMSSAEIHQRVCAQDTCWIGPNDEAGARWSISSGEACKSALTRRCRTNPFDSAAACVCLAGSAVPYSSDGRR